MTLPPRIARLVRLAELPERRVLGMMSGTSLDGLDLALCRIRGAGGDTRIELEHFRTQPYAPEERARLARVVSRREATLEELTVLHPWLAVLHARIVLDTLAQWDIAAGEVHLLASHGQTVFHAPGSWEEDVSKEDGSKKDGYEKGSAARHATLQLGDGDHLALRTGILTLSDFRQKEIAAGGQGAPLAPYAEALAFAGERPRLLLNLGGIANFTYLPAGGAVSGVRHGDTGPANALIDRAVRRFFPEHPDGFDRDGKLAAQGAPHEGLLRDLLEEPFFQWPCPKSTGLETFGDAYLEDAIQRAEALGISPRDLLATLTLLTVNSITATLRRELPSLAGAEFHVNGGGLHNPLIADGLRGSFPEMTWMEPGALGIPPDAREAVLFALLAHESLFGEGFEVLAGSGTERNAGGASPARDESGPRIGFGKLSWPD